MNNEHVKQFSSQNCILNQNSKLKTFEMSENKPKSNRLNRLFRRLFTFNRKIKSSSPLSTTPMTMIYENDTHMQQIKYNGLNSSVADTPDDTSKLVRFFNSFRSSTAYNRKGSTTMSEQIKSTDDTLKKTIDIDSSQNLPHISLIKVNTSCESSKTNEAFYLEVVEKLKSIADDCLFESEKSPSSVSNNYIESIPFIDDEELMNDVTIMSVSFDSQASNCVFHSSSLIENKFLSSTNNNNNNNHLNKVINYFFSLKVFCKSSYFKYELSEDLIKRLVDNLSYGTFDDMVHQATFQTTIDWYQIAIVFELISRTVKYLNAAAMQNVLIMKLKDIAVEYINNKYNKWIQSQKGGWLSIPDSKSISYKSFGEINNNANIYC